MAKPAVILAHDRTMSDVAFERLLSPECEIVTKVGDGRALVAAVQPHLPDLAVRDGKWKLLCEYDGSRAELYDLLADPAEKNNVAAAQPAEVRRLTAAVLEWHRAMPADNGATYRPGEGKKK